MPYRKRDKDGKPEEIPVRYVRSADYKTHYTHGAQGGILGSYHYRIDFYREDVPPTKDVVEKEGKYGPEDGKLVIIREIDLSVYMSLPFAKQLRDWLDRGISKYEEKHGEIKIVADMITSGEE